jgi:hypothetical protein
MRSLFTRSEGNTIYRQGIKPALARESGSQTILKASTGIPRYGQRNPEVKEFKSLPTVKEGKKKNLRGYGVLNFTPFSQSTTQNPSVKSGI